MPSSPRDWLSGLTHEETLLVEQQRTQDASEQEGRALVMWESVSLIVLLVALLHLVRVWGRSWWPWRKGVGGSHR